MVHPLSLHECEGMLRHAFFFVGCLWVFLVLHPTHSQTFNASEYSALKYLYDSTGGEYWTYYGTTDGHWNFSDPQPCVPTPWAGLTCDYSNVSVVKMYLSGFNLTGTIPASLGNLSQLESLDLYSNQLTGTIPATLGSLSQLKYLDLGENQLTGTIPASLGNLSQLEYLYLNSNQLTGTIPASLGNLSHLEYLYLYSNQLTGTIPESLGNLSLLEGLYLNSNQLTGTIPASLGNLSQLEGL